MNVSLEVGQWGKVEDCWIIVATHGDKFLAIVTDSDPYANSRDLSPNACCRYVNHAGEAGEFFDEVLLHRPWKARQ